MSETQHTPGPWQLDTVSTSCGVCHKIGPFPSGLSHRPETYACVYEDGLGKQVGMPQDTQLLANARLIAAAPEMLDLLRDCLDVLDNYSDVLDGEDGQPRANRAMSTIAQIEAVIAKAEGRS